MRSLRTIIIVTLAMALSVGMALAQPPQDLAKKTQQGNADLDRLAQDLSKLLTHQGFRGYLRSAIVKSKNRENILELDKFLDRAVKSSGMPPGLMKFKDSARNVQGRMKASGLTAFEGLDLYIPVDAQRSKWKGGKNVSIASGPLGDEEQIKQIVSYQVWDGKRALLDANRAPEKVVLVLAPEEHETHEVRQYSKVREPPPPPENPKPHFKGKHAPPAKGMKEPGGGNSWVGTRYIKIYKDQEPWWKGSPEIYVHIYQRRGNSCLSKDADCDGINHENTWYNAWWTRFCDPTAGMSFDSSYWNRLLVYILERDAGGHFSPWLYELYPGITCRIYRYSNDDYVDHGTTYRWNFGYEYSYYQHLGNAYVMWYKRH